MLKGDETASISWLGVGVGSPTATVTDNDTDNNSPLLGYDTGTRTPVSSYPSSDRHASFRATINSLDENGFTITKCGLFNGSTTGTMLLSNLHDAVTKTSAKEVKYEIILEVK